MTSRAAEQQQDQPPSRAERKARLLATIEQQRIDILVESSRWREASRPLDDGWRSLMRFRSVILAAGGLAVLQSARHPSSLVRVGKRIAAGALLLNRARRLFNQFR
ncbi:YqjK-like family protein [Halomonas sp. M5N1S17]|uniref:YqjK-like family protein n=1 Tax=Halomonas alkalisoli TaxID=2907158 RepID=UPI001F27EBB8|nr:YqjK-like family protein [Halomonas alkalisoli]